MTWALINAFFGLLAATIITYKLVVIPNRFNMIERIGMGLMGSGLILTLGLLMARDTPFDDWSTALLRAGCCIYFVGRMHRHRIANWTMKQQAKQHLGGKK